jgi:hypothetical protein
MSNVAQDFFKDKGYGKLAFLALVSASLSSFLPFFAPVPMVLASIHYGRKTGLILGIVCSLLLIFASTIIPQVTPVIYIAFMISFIFSLMVSESFFRQISPVRGIIIPGLSVIAFFVIVWGVASLLTEFSLVSELERNITLFVDEFIKANPDLIPLDKVKEYKVDLVKTYLEGIPSAFVAGIFITLWISFFVVLRNSVIWLKDIDYPYTIDNLITFKVPYFFVWPLITSLVLLLVGDILFGDVAVLIGKNALFSLGIFYFFQGFGIYLDLLNTFRIRGFMRSTLIIITVVLASKFVAAAGIFDMWFDLRKFFVKNDNAKDEEFNDKDKKN